MTKARPAHKGTELPSYEKFDPAKPYNRMETFCSKYGIAPESIRKALEPALSSGEVVSYRGEAPLYAYACGRDSQAITWKAHSVVDAAGIRDEGTVREARMELWGIFRDFSMGYTATGEERLGLISKARLKEWLNLSRIGCLCTGGLQWDLARMLTEPPLAQSARDLFGEIRFGAFTLSCGSMGRDSFTASFGMIVQGGRTEALEDGSALSVRPTHFRILESPPLQRDTPYVASTARAEGAICIAEILPESDEFRRLKWDFLLLRKEDTMIIAEVTGSFG